MNVSRTLYSVLLCWLLLAAGSAHGQSFRRAFGPQGSFCRDAVETAGGGFLMVGGVSPANSLFLQRTDANGAVLWTNHLSLNGAYGIAVCPAADGGFAVLCENYLDAGTPRNVVVKIDAAGAVQWSKILENPSLPNGFNDIAATADGGFAVAGTGRVLSPIADFYVRLLKLDASGALVWDHSAGLGDSAAQTALRLAELSGGDLLLAGEARGSQAVDGSDFYLARFDSQGNNLWQHAVAEPHYQRMIDLQVAADGGFVLLGETYQANPVQTAVLKTDGNGTALWYKEVLPTLNPNTPDMSVVVQCFAQDLGGNLYIPLHKVDATFLGHLSMLKLSAAGDSVWTHTTDVQDLPFAALYTSDNQFALVGKSGIDGQAAILLKTDWLPGSSTFFSQLSGTVFWDQNNNCTADGSEPGPPEFKIEAQNQFGEHLIRPVDSDGSYSFTLGPGDYTLTLHPPTGTETLWTACDTPTVTVAINQPGQAPAIGVQSLVACPYLHVELAAGPIRRCSTMLYTAYYCNYGSATATGASIQLSVDPLLTYVSSTPPLAGQSGNQYTFYLGDVAPGACNAVQAQFLLSCAAVTGQAICAEAHISPDSSCVPPDPLWDGSNLEISATCNGDAQFTITNTGAGMTGPANYVIIEDQIMYMQGAIQLGAGADTVITISNPSGYSYYAQTEQRPGHPGDKLPAAVVDMCSGQNGQSLSLQLPLNQGDPFLAYYCDNVVSSFDPNDKRGFPMGWRSEHYLEAGQEIEYMIRFQNTGNDTAFLIVVQDQLPPELNPASVRPGAASHPYTFGITDKNQLKFTFANVLLPDSTTNEAASHGYVTFRVAQQPNLPDGTRIENKAAIYFDFNDPVITDPYFHTIGRPLLTFTLDRPTANAIDLKIMPNPAYETAEFRLDGVAADVQLHWSLYNSLGQAVRTAEFSGNQYLFQRQGLAAGMYYFRLEDNSGKTASGTLILR